jgi:hypothetical protein
MIRVSLSAPQTQALVSLLCTLGTYTTIDVREYPSGDISVTVWRSGEPTRYRLAPSGATTEQAA